MRSRLDGREYLAFLTSSHAVLRAGPAWKTLALHNRDHGS
jgi:hypothetical protein